MLRHEYKVVPAPRRGTKAKEAKTSEDRFALTLTTLLNELGRDGWEYVRAETLPSDERVGFTRTRTVDQTVLVFRRAIEGGTAALLPDHPAAPKPIPAEAPVPRLGPAVEPPEGAAPSVGKAD